MKVIDLSYPFDKRTIYWPTATPFRLKKVYKGPTKGGYWYEANNYEAAEHGGTHIDAPVHFSKGRWTVDQIPLERLIGPLCVLDVKASAAKSPDYQVQLADVQAWEKRYGRLPRGAILVMNSGWGRFWGNKKKYLGTDKPGDTKNLHFPGFSKRVSEFLVAKRSLKAVGVDTPSIDPGQSTAFWAHRIFFARNIPGLENVANLDKVPAKGATIFAIPMNIAGGSGAPARFFATLS